MLVLVGPSASGKTEAAKQLIDKYKMRKLVTYTSRSKRPNEIEGVDYHFLTKEEFEKRIKEDFFLEYVDYNGNYYGTSKEGLDEDKVVILEPTGLKHYLLKAKDKIKICYLKCPIEIREERMKNRGDDELSIEKRLASDDKIFTPEIEKLADWVIDGYGKTIEAMGHEIYLLYKDKVNNR